MYTRPLVGIQRWTYHQCYLDRCEAIIMPVTGRGLMGSTGPPVRGNKCVNKQYVEWQTRVATIGVLKRSESSKIVFGSDSNIVGGAYDPPQTT